MADFRAYFPFGDPIPWSPPFTANGYIQTPGMHHIEELRAANRALEARIAALEALIKLEKPRGRHAKQEVNTRNNKTTVEHCEHGTPQGSARACKQCSYNYPA